MYALQIVEEMARTLRPQGRCVILIQSYQHLIACLDSKYFENINITGVNIGGYVCAIVTAVRTNECFKHPEQNSDTWGIDNKYHSRILTKRKLEE